MQPERSWASAPLPTSIIKKTSEPRRFLHAMPARGAAWAVLILCALAQTWWIRHIIFSDGISYIDIATNYARGDWHKALNEYWSPLLSWLLAAIFKLFYPLPYWQVAMLHVI